MAFASFACFRFMFYVTIMTYLPSTVLVSKPWKIIWFESHIYQRCSCAGLLHFIIRFSARAIWFWYINGPTATGNNLLANYMLPKNPSSTQLANYKRQSFLEYWVLLIYSVWFETYIRLCKVCFDVTMLQTLSGMIYPFIHIRQVYLTWRMHMCKRRKIGIYRKPI